MFAEKAHPNAAAAETGRPSGLCQLGSSHGAHCWAVGQAELRLEPPVGHGNGNFELQEGSRWKLLGAAVGDFLRKLGGSLASLPGCCLKADNLPGSRQSAGER